MNNGAVAAFNRYLHRYNPIEMPLNINHCKILIGLVAIITIYQTSRIIEYCYHRSYC